MAAEKSQGTPADSRAELRKRLEERVKTLKAASKAAKKALTEAKRAVGEARRAAKASQAAEDAQALKRAEAAFKRRQRKAEVAERDLYEASVVFEQEFVWSHAVVPQPGEGPAPAADEYLVIPWPDGDDPVSVEEFLSDEAEQFIRVTFKAGAGIQRTLLIAALKAVLIMERNRKPVVAVARSCRVEPCPGGNS